MRQQIEARACEHRSVWPTRRASSFHPHGGANVSDCFLPISPVYLAASASAALTPSAANAASTTAMGFTLYNLLKAVLLLTNALAILHPHRFLAAHGLDGAGLADGGGGVKQQVAGLLHATRFMRCACCLRALGTSACREHALPRLSAPPACPPSALHACPPFFALTGPLVGANLLFIVIEFLVG